MNQQWHLVPEWQEQVNNFILVNASSLDMPFLQDLPTVKRPVTWPKLSNIAIQLQVRQILVYSLCNLQTESNDSQRPPE